MQMVENVTKFFTSNWFSTISTMEGID